MEIGRVLTWTAERYPDRPAVGGQRSFTWRQWDARTNQIARALAQRGASKGDRVCLFTSNSEAMAATHLACQKLGVVSTPLNSRYAAEELAYCLKDAEPKVVLSDDRTVGVLREALERADGKPGFALLHDGDDRLDGADGFEDALAEQSDSAVDVEVGDDDHSVMLYTAGTTGRPKGVPRTHRNEHSASEAHVIQSRYNPWEATLGAMPMYHTMGLRSLLSMVVVGGKFVAIPEFKAGPALELIEQEKVSALYLVPTAYYSLAQDGGLEEAGKCVRRLGYAGAAMTPTLCKRLQEAVHPDVFVNHYGSTEIYTFSVEEDAASRPGSAGRPGIHSRLRLVTADAEERIGPDAEVEPGETGEIIASLLSPEAFQGYWNRPEATQKALRDGWYFTGDLGYYDDEGCLIVSGRVDDMIITGGENVHPLEVEDALAACPVVSELAVAGVSEERWGQAVTAFVVAEGRDDADAAAREIADWVRSDSGLTPYKRPKKIVILDEIPKSPVGKILRRKLVSGEYESLGEADTGRREQGASA
jgi:2-furoate---CoA ligase